MTEQEQTNKDLRFLEGEILEAQEQLANSRERLDLARREETNAINRLNGAQKKIDDYLAKMKKESPRGSDWKRSD